MTSRFFKRLESPVDRETAFRTELRFLPTVSYLTPGAEPSWRHAAGEEFFQWGALVECKILPMDNLVGEVAANCQRQWDAVRVNVQGPGGGVGVEGLFGLLHAALVNVDWARLHRSVERRMYANTELSPTAAATLDSLLFNTSRFLSVAEDLLIITYDGHKYGTVNRYAPTFADANPSLSACKAKTIKHSAHINNVPSAILSPVIKSTPDDRKITIQRTDHQIISVQGLAYWAVPAQVIWESCEDRNKSALWPLGEGWHTALRLNSELLDKYPHGLVATIPAMLELLHMNQTNIYEGVTTQAYAFDPPLSPKVSLLKRVKNQSLPENVSRSVKFLSEPKGTQYPSAKERKVVVVYPRDSRWATERIFWA